MFATSDENTRFEALLLRLWFKENLIIFPKKYTERGSPSNFLDLNPYAAAYRAAAKIEDITTGIVYDYTRKKGVDYSEILSPISTSLGNEWLTDRQELWNKIEEVERRKDA